jgi:polyisoprenoid-binding protein YceI
VTALSTKKVHVPKAGKYVLEPARSSIAFTTKHMFGMGKVKGSFDLTDGELTVLEPATASSVVARASAHSFETGSKQRDKQVVSRMFLDAANHPEIEFRSGAVTKSGGGWVLAGELIVRGRSAPVEFTVTEVKDSDAVLTIRASARVDRYAYGVTKMKGMAARYLDLDVTVGARRV